MAKRHKNLKYIILITILSLVIIFLIGRIPILRVIYGPPTIHQFYGNVYLPNETLVKDGILVYAIVSDNIVEEGMTKDGKYGYEPLFIIENINEGSLIEFYLDDVVNNVKVAEYEFKNLELTELNLYFDVCGDGYCASSRGESCSSCSQDCGSCPTPPSGDGGGGGVGGVGGVYIPPTVTPPLPEEEEIEEEIPIEKEAEEGRAKIAGKAIEEGLEKENVFMFILVLSIVVVAIIVLFIVLRKKSRKKNKKD